MAITTTFDPPLISDDQATFNTKAFDTVDKLNTWAGEANSTASAVNADAAAAAASETAAGDSETAAAASASAAAGSASAASTSATNAATSASEALTYRNEAGVLINARYLGAKASDPSVDNDGNPLTAGALYFNTVADEMRAYDGTVWDAAYLPAGDYVQASQVDPDLAYGVVTYDQLGALAYQDAIPETASVGGGAASTSIASNTTLTTEGLHRITATVSGLVVSLPDATSMPKGSVVVTVKNSGAFPFFLQSNGGGQVFGEVGLSETYMLMLADNSTAAGVWVGGKVDVAAFGFGLASVFESADTSEISVAALSETKAIVCYRDTPNGFIGTACVLDLSGGVITPGTPVVFENAYTSYTSVAALSETKAIVCYQDVGNSGYGTACVLDVSGSTITPGTPFVYYNIGSTSYQSVVKLTSTTALVVYFRPSQSVSYTIVLSVSGSTITAGPQVSIGQSATYNSLSALSDTKVILGFVGGASNYPSAVILDISGTTVTPGSVVTVSSVSSYATSVAVVGANKAIITYSNFANSRAEAKVLSVSGSTIAVSASTAILYNVGNASYTSFHIVFKVGENKAIVIYSDQNVSNTFARFLSAPSTTIIQGAEIALSNYNLYNAVAPINANKFMYAYRDDRNASYGTARIIGFND